MNVLVACECSGRVKTAFRKLKHDAWSCDLKESEIPDDKFHYQCDVREVLNNGWDLMIAHPDCTFLTVTGNKWMLPEYSKRFPNRQEERENAVKFFMLLANANIDKIAIENPVGIMSTRWRKPDCIIQPYYFGDTERKTTCLWLKNLPPLMSVLKPATIAKPELYVYADGRTDGMMHVKTMRLSPNERATVRSRTFQGIANAMAEQWG
jgi:site-specific DNA-cytosine methylase